MSLMFRDPVRLLDDFWTEVDPIYASINYQPGTSSGTNASKPRKNFNRCICMDCFETDQEFKVIVECAGVPKDKLDVSVDNYMLTVRCNKEAPDYSGCCNMVRNELTYGTESRSVRIPSNCSQDPSCCTYKDGCLCICFPKSPEHEGKKLQIECA